jgi:hypothetical protein
LVPAALKFSITALRAVNGCLYGPIIVGVVDGQERGASHARRPTCSRPHSPH